MRQSQAERGTFAIAYAASQNVCNKNKYEHSGEYEHNCLLAIIFLCSFYIRAFTFLLFLIYLCGCDFVPRPLCAEYAAICAWTYVQRIRQPARVWGEASAESNDNNETMNSLLPRIHQRRSRPTRSTRRARAHTFDLICCTACVLVHFISFHVRIAELG